jgi:hypothetical protein
MLTVRTVDMLAVSPNRPYLQDIVPVACKLVEATIVDVADRSVVGMCSAELYTAVCYPVLGGCGVLCVVTAV